MSATDSQAAPRRVVVVGAGISGLAAAWHLRERARERSLPLELTILEAEDRAGGKIRSEQADGFLVEWGPNGFLDSKPATLSLCREVGLSPELLRSSDLARKRFLYADGELHRLPENPALFAASRLLTGAGKWRMAAEAFLPKRNAPSDESVAEFTRRRLGGEALERLIGPMVSGIHAGDPELISLAAAFPRIHELEQSYGGLFRAMFQLMRERRRGTAGEARKAVPQPAGSGTLTSFANGMETLPRRLTELLSGQIRYRTRLAGLEPLAGGGFRLDLAGPQGSSTLDADQVLLTVPAYQSAGLLEALAPQAAAALSGIRYAPVTVVGLGVPEWTLPRALDGFGYLIARDQPRFLLGCLWSSSIFPGQRAPQGMALLRVMVGGTRQPENAVLPDGVLLDRVLRDLRQVLGGPIRPEFVRLVRWERSIPQYELGHRQRVAAVAAALRGLPGLWVGGNALRGVALNDCVAEGARLAGEMLGG